MRIAGFFFSFDLLTLLFNGFGLIKLDWRDYGLSTDFFELILELILALFYFLETLDLADN